MNKSKKKARPLLKGLARMVCGVIIATIFTASVFGYTIVPAEDGYLAVLDFLAATAALVATVVGTYYLGIVGNDE